LSHTFKTSHVTDPQLAEMFARLERALNDAQPEFSFYKRNAAPTRYWEGMVVFADGTNWNPGSGAGLYRYTGSIWKYLEGTGGGGSGTVTSVSVVSANGFAGTVATAGTTPAITLTTSITGLLKGNGTAISAATAGTDYVAPGGALGTPSSGTLTNCTFPTLNQNTTGSAATLTTSRLIYGNGFNGSADVTAIIASTFGGTGNGFTKFSGPATSEKTFTLPNLSVTLPGIQSSVLIIKQPAPASKAAASTLTAAEMLGRLALYTGAASTLTTATGTQLDAAVTMAVDEAFEFIINNTGSGTCTFTMGAGMTASGTMTVAAGTSQHFTIRKTAANAFTIYRA
jgi:hypothetical protein